MPVKRAIAPRRRGPTVTEDFDFHPDEATVRVFVTPRAGVLRLDDDLAVTEAEHDGIVLRHYAFADQWFKVNVTTDLAGKVVETGDPDNRFALNCDIATPMERDGDAFFGVDLFADVLVRADAQRYWIGDLDELADAVDGDLISRREERQARRGLARLVELVETARLLPWLDEVQPFGPCAPPPALPMERRAVPSRLRAGRRRTW